MHTWTIATFVLLCVQFGVHVMSAVCDYQINDDDWSWVIRTLMKSAWIIWGAIVIF